jgi:hypothetical protein
LLDVDVDDSSPEITIVRLIGVLSIATMPRLSAALLKCLSDQPKAVVVDMDLLAVQHVVALNVFAVAARQASVWSGAQLILVSGPALEGRLKPRARVLARFVRIYPTMTVALASARRVPVRRMSMRFLTREPASAAIARHHVEQICCAWKCGTLCERAVAIADELVGHAILRGRDDPILRMEQRRGLLTVSVINDQEGRRGSTASFEPFSRAIVTALASEWGSNPVMSGGTIVWALLRDAESHELEPGLADLDIDAVQAG